MAQLQRMDARLDTLFMELYQVNVHVGRIALQQASMGGFAPEATPSPPTHVASASEDEDDDDGNNDNASMMLMEMLALLMRCLLDTLTFCYS